MAQRGRHALNFYLVLNCVILLEAVNQSLFSRRDEVKRLLGYPRDSLLNFTQQTAEYGYRSEEHSVVTEDGYVLRLFRVAGARGCPEGRRGPPVVLMHGLLQSADSWVDAGPGAGLAYLLADACRDLWLGNTRGNYYSRRHLRLDPDRDPAFWHFSVDEIGYYDPPAIIDYVLRHTGAETLHYIGFSQGAGTFLVMCSERPEYCHKAELLVALAPATRHINCKSPVFRLLGETFMKLEDDLKTAGVVEVLSKGSLSQELLAFICQFVETIEFCDVLKNVLDSSHKYHKGSTVEKAIKTLVGHFPAGTSLHNMARYGQAMSSQAFVKFNYGSEKNLKLYGSVDPPEFNLSAVTVPVVVIYGENDGVVDITDVEWLMDKLPRVLEAVLVRNPLWNHLDVNYSRYISKEIFPKIIEYLIKYGEKWIR